MHTDQLRFRPAAVMKLLENRRPMMPVTCLGYGKDGSPRHPLMLSYNTPRIPYVISGGRE
jgi:hypothetical protein